MITDKIIELIKINFHLKCENNNISYYTSENIEGWDSLAVINLVFLLEEEFSITLEDTDILNVYKGGEQLLAVVTEKISG